MVKTDLGALPLNQPRTKYAPFTTYRSVPRVKYLAAKKAGQVSSTYH